MKSVKIDDKEYEAIKELAKTQGRFLTALLNEAVRAYLKAYLKAQEPSAGKGRA